MALIDTKRIQIVLVVKNIEKRKLLTFYHEHVDNLMKNRMRC